MQLGTNPNTADAQPVYPSEDPGDYVTLTLRLGASGKLADTANWASPGLMDTLERRGAWVWFS